MQPKCEIGQVLHKPNNKKTPLSFYKHVRVGVRLATLVSIFKRHLRPVVDLLKKKGYKNFPKPKLLTFVMVTKVVTSPWNCQHLSYCTEHTPNILNLKPWWWAASWLLSTSTIIFSGLTVASSVHDPVRAGFHFALVLVFMILPVLGFFWRRPASEAAAAAACEPSGPVMSTC